MNISLVDSDLDSLIQLTGLALKWKEVGDHLGVLLMSSMPFNRITMEVLI